LWDRRPPAIGAELIASEDRPRDVADIQDKPEIGERGDHGISGGARPRPEAASLSSSVSLCRSTRLADTKSQRISGRQAANLLAGTRPAGSYTFSTAALFWPAPRPSKHLVRRRILPISARGWCRVLA